MELSYLETEGVRIEDGKEVCVLGMHGPIDKIEQAKKILQQLVDLNELKKYDAASGNHDSSNGLWNSCSLSSTTLSSTNINKIIPHENFDGLNNQEYNNVIFENELNPIKSNDNKNELDQFISRFSEINNLFNDEYKRLNKKTFENIIKIAVKFYSNFNKNNIDMDYTINKNTLNEITELVSFFELLKNYKKFRKMNYALKILRLIICLLKMIN